MRTYEIFCAGLSSSWLLELLVLAGPLVGRPCGRPHLLIQTTSTIMIDQRPKITNTKLAVIPTEQHNAMVNLIPYWRWQLVFFGFSWPILRCWGRSDINIKDWHDSSLCYLKYWFSTQPPHLDLDQKWNWLWSFIFYQTRADHWLCLSLIHSRTH